MLSDFKKTFLRLYFSLLEFIFGSFSKPYIIVSVGSILTSWILLLWSSLLNNPVHTDLSPTVTRMGFLLVGLWGSCWWASQE